jgi:hypothetical protein
MVIEYHGLLMENEILMKIHNFGLNLITKKIKLT